VNAFGYILPLPTNARVVDVSTFRDKVIIICEDMSVWCRKVEPAAKWLRIVPYPYKKK
jgi:hypothetical protein